MICLISAYLIMSLLRCSLFSNYLKSLVEESSPFSLLFYFRMSDVYRKGYFSMDNVFNTMFQLSERLFQIKFEVRVFFS